VPRSLQINPTIDRSFFLPEAKFEQQVSTKYHFDNYIALEINECSAKGPNHLSFMNKA